MFFRYSSVASNARLECCHQLRELGATLRSLPRCKTSETLRIIRGDEALAASYTRTTRGSYSSILEYPTDWRFLIMGRFWRVQECEEFGFENDIVFPPHLHEATLWRPSPGSFSLVYCIGG